MYNYTYWSNFVESEFDRRFLIKYKNLLSFYSKIRIDMIQDKELYDIRYLKDYVEKNYTGKELDDIMSSLEPFWREYFDIQTKIPFETLFNGVQECYSDLTINTFTIKNQLKNRMIKTPKRTDEYVDLKKELKSFNVSDEDCNVILDGHDFALNQKDPIDFVTFDFDCYNGADKVNILSFESVKYHNSFN